MTKPTTDPFGGVDLSGYPAVLTVEQAADLVQVSPATIYRYSSEGRLAGFASRGGRVRILRDPFVRWYFRPRSRSRRTRS